MEGYTIPEAADLAGVGRRELREAVEQGLVPATRREGRWQISMTNIEELRLALATREDPATRLAAEPVVDGTNGSERELQRLRGELEALARRVAALEAQRAPDAGGRSEMRPALTPFFKQPEAEPRDAEWR